MNEQKLESALVAELTQLKQRVAELESNQNQYQALLENMNEGLLRVDFKGIIEYVNPRFCQLVGYAQEEVIAHKLDEYLYDKSDREFVEQKLKNHRQGQSEQYEIRIKTKLGHCIWTNVSGIPLKDNRGRIVAVMAIISDISRRKRDERKIVQRTQEMAALYKTSLEMNALPDSASLLQSIVTRASKLTGSFGGALFLLRPDNETLQMVVNYNQEGQNRNITLKLGQGVAGKVALSGEPLAVENYDTWNGQTDDVLRAGPRGRMAGVPLKHGGQVVGVLNVFDKTPGYFTQEQIQLLCLFADQAVLVLENKRRYNQSQQKPQPLPLLNQLAREMTSILEVQALCQTVVQRVYDVFEYDRVGILTVDTNINELALQAIAGQHLPELKPGQYTQPISMGITGRAVITGEVIIANDVNNHPDFFDLPGVVTGAQMTIPLKVGHEVLGVMVISKEEAGLFAPDEVAVLTTIGDQLALSLEKGRLFEETRRRAEQLDTLRRISQELIALHDHTLLLSHISEYAIKLLKGDTCGLDLYNPEEKSVERVVSLGNTKTPVGGKHYLNDGLIGRVMQTGELIIVADYQNWDGKMTACADVTGCILGIPIQWREELLGVLSIRRFDVHNQFVQEDVTLAVQFAGLVAIAVRNARLFSQAQQEIAERKQAERELKIYAKELERSNKALDRFAIDAAHDLAAPLRSVARFNLQLQNNYSSKLDERALDYLQRIQNAIGRMQALTKNLLTYAEIGNQNKPFEKVHLNWAIEDVIADLHVQIKETGAQINVERLPIIEADETQMRQLFQNLINNALKFQRPQTTPQIAVFQNPRPSPEFCQIVVQDNGIGFDESEARQIFTLFGRLHGKQEYEGSGIGLATCQRIVEQHGGNISVKSEPGKGTSFIIQLPVTATSDKAGSLGT